VGKWKINTIDNADNGCVLVEGTQRSGRAVLHLPRPVCLMCSVEECVENHTAGGQ